MNKFYLVLIFVISLLFAGCQGLELENFTDEDLQRIGDSLVLCNEPYIRVGMECCLDLNQNNICDRDEGLTVQDQQETHFSRATLRLEGLEMEGLYLVNRGFSNVKVTSILINGFQCISDSKVLYSGVNLISCDQLLFSEILETDSINEVIVITNDQEVFGFSSEFVNSYQSSENNEILSRVIFSYVIIQTSSNEVVPNKENFVSVGFYLSSQSNKINIEDLTIRFDSQFGTQRLTYSNTNLPSTTSFSFNYELEGPNFVEGYVSPGDLVEFTFIYGGEIKENLTSLDEISIRIINEDLQINPLMLRLPENIESMPALNLVFP